MSRQGQISYEPSTLVYTLLENSEINFEDFNLLIRSMHTFMVNDIVSNPDKNNVHVKLGYQASVANAQAKLGDLAAVIAVTKMSAFVKEHEFSHLDELRRRFNIPSSSSSIEETPQPAKRTRGGPVRRAFTARPVPYKKATLQKPMQTVYEEREAADYYPGHDPTDQQ
uniref:Uncharacterized protein n=1 Tax=Phylloscopus fuscatus densovirus TaxID=2794500 RepID=A0A8A4XCD8_9VIRU|nr:MAG: hypothetical protein [Phylloscopus fuscatus densovirus]